MYNQTKPIFGFDPSHQRNPELTPYIKHYGLYLNLKCHKAVMEKTKGVKNQVCQL